MFTGMETDRFSSCFAKSLLKMAKRSNASVIEFPMSRQDQDIADYLGLTIEMTSRTFTCFGNKHAIKQRLSTV